MRLRTTAPPTFLETVIPNREWPSPFSQLNKTKLSECVFRPALYSFLYSAVLTTRNRCGKPLAFSLATHRQPFASFSAPSLEHEAPPFARHPLPEAVHLFSLAVVWLERSFALAHYPDISLTASA